jgi:hypothetical protein
VTEPDALSTDLLPGWQEWAALGQSTSAMLFGELTLKTLALASRIFWPALTWQGECLLLTDGNSPKKLDQWRQKLDGDLREVESICNLRRLADLVPDDEQHPIANAGLEHLGELVRSTWQMAVDRFVGSGRYEVFGAWNAAEEDYRLTIRRLG